MSPNTTRVGEAIFPYLTKPDTDYNSEGVYHVKLKLKKDKSKELVKRIEEVISQQIAEHHKLHPSSTDLIKRAPKPYAEDEKDKDSYIFKFKSKFKPKLYDKQGEPLDETKSIWGGTTMAVSYQTAGYRQSIGVGCTLRLVDCQIDNLVEGTTNNKKQPLTEAHY